MILRNISTLKKNQFFENLESKSPLKFFCFISKIQFFMNFLMELVKFSIFFLTFFQHEEFWINNKKTIGMQRRDLQLKSRARIKSIRQKEGKWQVFIRRGPLDPL